MCKTAQITFTWLCIISAAHRFDMGWNECAFLQWACWLHEWFVEYYRFDIEFILCHLDWITYYIMVFGASEFTSKYWKCFCFCILRFNISRFYFTTPLEGIRIGPWSVVSTWAMGSVWSDAFIGRCICCWNDIFIFEIGSHIFDKSTFGTVTSIVGPNDYRYHKVFLYLHIGIVCVRLWSQSITLVLCWFGKAKMLSFASRYTGFW